MTSALTTLQQWLLFSATMLVIGCVAWRMGVAPRAGVSGEGGADASGAAGGSRGTATTDPRVASLGLLAAAALVVAWALRMVVQVMGFRDPFVPLWDDVSFLLFEVFFGTLWMAQGVVIALLGIALWAARRNGSTAAWSGATLLAGALALTLAMSGHAYGAENRWLAVAADALHTTSAGVWIGTLAVILTAGRGGADAPSFAAQIRAFSTMALVSGGILVTMGSFLSWTHLPEFSDFWTEPYGRWLSAKIALAMVIFSLGAWNWRKGLPEMDSSEGAAAVRRRGALEVWLAVGVVLLTAILVHSGKPS